MKALDRGMGGSSALHPVSSYDRYYTGMPTHDAEYDEADPQVLVHNPSELDDD